MDGGMLGLIEMALVLGLTLGLGVWQLVSVRRAMRDPPKRDRDDPGA
ncbi:hypothetical protein ABEG18_22915 [Alsobacter sp. KACC 23698]|uniref:Uncharacterized protein n=1 Tax=Alsobacter sp. KACC 23698 TaxID=3149229 RepID=A0AAU7JDR4_9HYPH